MKQNVLMSVLHKSGGYFVRLSLDSRSSGDKYEDFLSLYMFTQHATYNYSLFGLSWD